MSNETAARDGQAALGTADQYLTFMLAGEEYGIDILRVQEIKGWDRVTRIPHAPDYVLGVINLRGTVVPVL
ncbi:MAG TPA: chemotaxis protein CheW, partial [Steroidobacteraceae bacterium]